MMSSNDSSHEIRDFYSNPTQMLAIANEVLDFISSDTKPKDGSFAKKILSKSDEGEFDPLVSILEYPQYHLLIAADAIKHVGSSIINHQNSTSKEPLPLYSFLILCRTAIESLAITQWLLEFDDEDQARQKAIQIMQRNLRSLGSYLRVRTKISLELGRTENPDQENFEDLRTKTINYAIANGLKIDDIPNMLSSQDGIGLLSKVSGTALELLYVQLSSLVHANTWSFSLNSSRKSEHESDTSGAKRVQYAHNQEILNEALAISCLMLGTTFMSYRELFVLQTPELGS